MEIVSGWGAEARVPGPLHSPPSSPDSVLQRALKLAGSYGQEREAQCKRYRVGRTFVTARHLVELGDLENLTQSKSGRCVRL